MPRSLITSNSQIFEPILNTKRTLKTTSKMVEDALIEMHSFKGITLKQIQNFILAKYDLDVLTKRRTNLIRKHILKLRASEDIMNRTGRGLIGHIKLISLKKFIQKRMNNKQSKIKKPNINAKQVITAFPNNNGSIFDTPMPTIQAHASTPLIRSNLVLRAPEVKKNRSDIRSARDNVETPRSSLSLKRRILRRRPEKK